MSTTLEKIGTDPGKSWPLTSSSVCWTWLLPWPWDSGAFHVPLRGNVLLLIGLVGDFPGGLS